MGYGVDQATPLLLLISYHVLLMASMSPATASPLCFSNQSSALLRFKQGLVLYQQHSYDPLSSWKIGTDCCKWEGITCDDNNLTGGFVTALQINDVTRKYSSSSTVDPSLFELRYLRILFLSRIGFEGFELARLVELTHLTHLGLSVNLLSGQIPPEISQMTSLVSLDLSNNYLSGQIPPEISQMTSLVSLDLSNNYLSGQIPPEISQMTSLVYLNLGWNHLSGCIPPEISQMTSLVSLYLSHNDGLRLQHPSFAEFVKRLGHLQHLHLDGVNISTSTGKEVSLATSSFLPNLQTLVLNNCSIHGPMHESILRLRSLSLLDLRINNLGYLTDFFSNFTSLQQLLLGDAQLKGKFPWGILQLPQLKRLALSQNPHLIVSLPPLRVESSNLEELDLSSVKVLSTNSLLEFSSKLSHLNTLHLSACGLNGMIPSSWASPNISLVTLNNNNLSGPIPETWSKLSNLYFLDLSNNLLSGSIPPGLLNNHPSLGRLNLANNRLNGSLFPFYAHFSNLMSLNINNNLLSGEIPSSISRLSNLFTLTLSSNNLTGSIPTSICNCSQLSVLGLNNNSLAGTIPSCLTRLSVLSLGRNQLQGSIPDGFSYLKVLQLNDNLLVGKIPRSLYNCSSLQLLDMGNNKLEDTFPSWMGNLTKLKVLVLHSNRLYGSITSFDLEGAFPLVQIFDIADNRFSGVLPSTLFKTFKAMMVNNEIGNGNLDIFIGSYGFGMYSSSSSCAPNVMLTIKGSNMLHPKIIAGLTTIDLSSNRFTGEIPEEIVTLAGLRVLNMSHNHLKGPIPKSLGNLLQMESLDLSHNQLTGGIPQEMTKLTFLSKLNLSFNNLQGRIPTERQFSTFDDTCFEGNPELCGTLSRPCPVSSARDTPLIAGNDQEPEWEYMAPGLGFVVGLAATILPILLSKRMGNWYWDLVDKVLASLLRRH